MSDVTIPAGMWKPTGDWDGPPTDRALTVQPTGVMAAPEPGWLTVVGYRACEPDEVARPPVTVRVVAAALPEQLRPAGGAR